MSTCARFLTISCFLALASAATAQTTTPTPPEQRPFLRIEAGAHTSFIQAIGLSRDEGRLVTGSSDKTVRVWKLPGGNLERVLRVPIGDDEADGRIYAVAISPDGRTVAAGGSDAAFATEQQHYVYLFDANSGRLLRRLGPAPSTIRTLRFSPDGSRLAGGLGETGIRLWETSTWRQVAEDRDYGDFVSAIAFEPSGRIAASSYDGRIRVYGPDLRLLRKGSAPAGTRPHDVAFSPNGQRLAIGYDDVTTVDIVAPETMARIFATDVQPAGTTKVLRCQRRVAWSGDGSRLFASALGQFCERLPLLVSWENEGRGARKTLGGPTSTVSDLLPWSTGVAMGGAGFFGLIDGQGSTRLLRGSVTPDMRGKTGENFLVAGDARQIRFGLRHGGTEPWLFDINRLGPASCSAAVDGLRQCDTTGLPIEGWQDSIEAPRLFGKPLTLPPRAITRSLAIAPDKQSFALGGEWILRRFDAAGEQLWQRPVAGVTWGVNLSADGRVIVAAYSDGTIRWHEAEQGRELLALFVHVPQDTAAAKRWVLWTPKGYYAASPGGEDLIGWHINRSWDQAPDFFPARAFRSTFYRPDIVQTVLETLDEEKAIAEANRRAGIKRPEEDVGKLAPPVIEIQDAEEIASFATADVTLIYRVRSPSGAREVDIQVLIDGEKVHSAAPQRVTALPTAAPDSLGSSLALKLPPRDVTITLVARSGDRVSTPVSRQFRWTGTRTADKSRPRLRALLVGVNDYQSADINRLSFAAKDARDFGKALSAQRGRAFTEVETQVVENADRDQLLKGLAWLESASQAGDISVVFLAGHGVTDTLQEFYFLPRDADLKDVPKTSFGKSQLIETVQRIRGKIMVLIDACHSADAFEPSGRLVGRVDMTRLANDVGSPENGVMMYAASSGRQLAQESQGWGNGAFTKALLEGFTGAADFDKDGSVDTDELGLWLRKRVSAITDGLQEPIALKSQVVPDYTLATIK